MARLVAGEDRALDDLMERHATRVFQFLYRMLGSEEDASDLAQEAFIRVFQHRDRFDPRARFSTWLYTIAGNLARNHHRWRSRHPTLPLDAAENEEDRRPTDVLPSPGGTPVDAVAAGERAAAVRAAVEALPPDLREAVVLCEWQELPVAEAALVLRTTPKAVESRLYRARRLLRGPLAAWL